MTAISGSGTSGVSARFEVIEPNGRFWEQDADHCLAGRGIVVDPGRLGAYCLRALPRRIDDLALLAGAVAFADKYATRKVALTWRRQLHLSVPVLEPDFWSQGAVNKALIQTLGILAGDGWTFEFTRRQASLTAGRQSPLPFSPWTSAWLITCPTARATDTPVLRHGYRPCRARITNASARKVNTNTGAKSTPIWVCDHAARPENDG